MTRGSSTGIRLRGGPAANQPTPWLRKVFKQMMDAGFDPHRKWCLDLGAGNGRNSDWLRKQGMQRQAYDPSPPNGYVYYWNGLGWPPYASMYMYDVILLQYVLMFVPENARRKIAGVINAAARIGCVLVLEAYEAKNQHYKKGILLDFASQLNNELLVRFGMDLQWKLCMSSTNDHLALQLQVKNAINPE